MPQFSIIVPVYNVEEVLSRCIVSIIKQNYKDFELILIDDGSEDASGRVCDEYAEKDKRIKVIHQSNAGVAAARNAGLGIAIGTYVVFVDSDDYVEDSYLSDLERSRADMVIVGHSLIKGDNEEKVVYSALEGIIALDNKEQIESVFREGALDYICSKRFSRMIIEQSGLRFDDRYAFGEDTVFNVSYMTQCSNIEIGENTSYCYVKYDHETLSNRKIDRSYVQNLEMYSCTLLEYMKSILPDRYDDVMNIRLGYAYRDILYAIIRNPKKYSFFFLKFVIGQRGFRTSLCKINLIYCQENQKFRTLLRLKSPILIWLFIQYTRLRKNM